MCHTTIRHIRGAAGLQHLIDTHRGGGAVLWHGQARVHPAHGLPFSTHGAVGSVPGGQGTQAGLGGGGGGGGGS